MNEMPRIREYLLQRLSGSDRSELEQRLFESDAFFDQVRAEEELLMDEYLQARMSRTDRESFGRRLESSDDLRERTQMRLAFFTALGKTSLSGPLTPQRSNRSTPYMTVAALGALGVALVLGALFFQPRRTANSRSIQIASAGLSNFFGSNDHAVTIVGTVIDLPVPGANVTSTGPVIPLFRGEAITEIHIALPYQPVIESTLRITVRSNGHSVLSLAPVKPEYVRTSAFVTAYLPTASLVSGIYQVEVVSDPENRTISTNSFVVEASH